MVERSQIWKEILRDCRWLGDGVGFWIGVRIGLGLGVGLVLGSGCAWGVLGEIRPGVRDRVQVGVGLGFGVRVRGWVVEGV
eukprot:11181098-Karenia_brevis.AAC.1